MFLIRGLVSARTWLAFTHHAACLDGTLSVESPPGGPTIISAVLPCG
jgi:hypothetical protein